MCLKALLIKNIQCKIQTHYILEKLRLMQRHPETPEIFLDLDGTIIYNVLIGE